MDNTLNFEEADSLIRRFAGFMSFPEKIERDASMILKKQKNLNIEKVIKCLASASESAGIELDIVKLSECTGYSKKKIIRLLKSK